MSCTIIDASKAKQICQSLSHYKHILMCLSNWHFDLLTEHITLEGTEPGNATGQDLGVADLVPAAEMADDSGGAIGVFVDKVTFLKNVRMHLWSISFNVTSTIFCCEEIITYDSSSLPTIHGRNKPTDDRQAGDTIGICVRWEQGHTVHFMAQKTSWWRQRESLKLLSKATPKTKMLNTKTLNKKMHTRFHSI